MHSGWGYKFGRSRQPARLKHPAVRVFHQRIVVPGARANRAWRCTGGDPQQIRVGRGMVAGPIDRRRAHEVQTRAGLSLLALDDRSDIGANCFAAPVSIEQNSVWSEQADIAVQISSIEVFY